MKREILYLAYLREFVSPRTTEALITQDEEPSSFEEAFASADSSSWRQPMGEEMYYSYQE